MISRLRSVRSPCLEIPPDRCLPPLPRPRGVSPTQATKSRAVLNTRALGTFATAALAVIGPTLGTSISRHAASSARTARSIWRSSARMSESSASHCPASSNRAARPTSGITPSDGLRSCSISVRNPLIPCAATSPNSFSPARSALAVIVRWRIKSVRVLWITSTACCSTLFTATNRIVGRPIASHTPSASRPSFLLRFTYGFTYDAGISRTS